jgi:uncharacterized protein YqgV (UPF0045/DUF77 family)
MMIQAEVSIYPLRSPSLAEPIQRFIRELRRGDLEIETGPMSTRVSGDCRELFRLLSRAFEHTADTGEILLTAKISNACPVSRPENTDR